MKAISSLESFRILLTWRPRDEPLSILSFLESKFLWYMCGMSIIGGLGELSSWVNRTKFW